MCRLQAIIWTNAGILLIRTLGTDFSEISSEINSYIFVQENTSENVACEMAVILLVRAITRDPFKLGSPNLDQRCKRPLLRFHLFCGLIGIDIQGQI